MLGKPYAAKPYAAKPYAAKPYAAKPFNMIIVGKTACGKTKYLLNLLETNYKGCFEYIFLICPTFVENKTYRCWKYESDEDYITIPCDQDHVDYWLKYIVQSYKGTNSLIILDDCASGKDVKCKTSELVKLGFSARHYSFSTIVITQQLTSIAKAYRENISKLVTFYNPNKKDLQEIFSSYLDVTKEEEENIKKTLKDRQWSKLEINLIYPYSHAVS